jgi:hypothetical protein
MVLNVQISPASAGGAVAGDIPAFPAFIGGIDTAVTTTSSVSAVTDGLTLYTRYTYNYVDIQGNILDRATSVVQNFVRYVEYPGQRIFRKVRFDVNGGLTPLKVC